jgi:L-rhamnose isomerase
MPARSSDAAYKIARQRYADLGVDIETSLERLSSIPVSLQCWQGDDVGGFENLGTGLTGGIAATGNYPGKARSPEELRRDAEKALSLIPGKHRFNLHAFYGEFGGRKVDRDEIEPGHFKGWIDWARSLGIGLDFNPTFFSHPNAADGFTLSHPDKEVRNFWIRHGIACRRIGAAMGKALRVPCVINHWIPDGMKDTPADRKGPRERLEHALDAMLKDKISNRLLLDSVEGKLFGIGCESYTVGSHEFYLGYAVKKGTLYTLDSGHYHPTETIADKISSVFPFVREILLHVSRGVRWDSDHVVVYNDDLQAIALELVRGNYLSRTRIGLDFFDASINRIAAWVIGTRNMIKALLFSLLEPSDKLLAMEAERDYTGRLALMEELKTMPFGAVWEQYCERLGVPAGLSWLKEVKQYEKSVLNLR